jgi:ferredoxin-like protein FixX
MSINYIQGDLFDHVDCGDFIPHVCNNRSGWGRGFVIPLAKFCPKAKEVYLQAGKEDMLMLGETQFINCGNDVVVCNMVAQTLFYDVQRNLDYVSLAFCMEQVRYEFLECGGQRILCPKFGSDLAGGNWEFIADLIEDSWIKNGIDVTVVEYLK